MLAKVQKCLKRHFLVTFALAWLTAYTLSRDYAQFATKKTTRLAAAAVRWHIWVSFGSRKRLRMNCGSSSSDSKQDFLLCFCYNHYTHAFVLRPLSSSSSVFCRGYHHATFLSPFANNSYLWGSLLHQYCIYTTPFGSDLLQTCSCIVIRFALYYEHSHLRLNMIRITFQNLIVGL